MKFDLLIQGGRDAAGHRLDVAIRDGRIMGTGSFEEKSANRVLDAQGKILLPNLIDPHVHFNQPGRSEWEGLATGTAAARAGGIATVFDMPLNSTPPVLSLKEFEAKQAAIAEHACIDVKIWAGIIPGNHRDLKAMARAGAIGFKAFYCDSGLDEFPATDRESLIRAMQEIADTGLRVAVHAEHPAYLQPGGSTSKQWCENRPIQAELAAIEDVIRAAAKTGCKAHIVHISSAEGIQLVHRLKQMLGIDVTCETCPHYLLLNQADMERIGARAKCAPPLRPEQDRQALVDCFKTGLIDVLGSDHSPCLSSMKDGRFDEAWGGISGVQHGLQLLYAAMPDALPMIVDCMSTRVASAFGLRKTGQLAAGQAAPRFLLNPAIETNVDDIDLLYRNRQSAFTGMSLRGKFIPIDAT